MDRGEFRLLLPARLASIRARIASPVMFECNSRIIAIE